MSGVRESLVQAAKSIPSSCNAGLLLDRYYVRPEQAAEESKKAHLSRACTISPPEGYAQYCARRTKWMFRAGFRVFRAASVGRILVGLGRATTWENGITLHHTWGTPLIPGSALKGLAAAFAHQHLDHADWRRRLRKSDGGGADTDGGESHNLLFGTNDEQGCVCFHDALWVNGSGSGLSATGLALDTITVHHQAYYGSERPGDAPGDWDAPVPVPFLSTGGDFIFALSGPAPWVDAAFGILEQALQQMGIGAKTSSGYGRMTLTEEESRVGAKVAGFAFPKAKGELNRMTEFVDQLLSEDNEDRAIMLRLFVARASAEPALVKNHLQQLANERPVLREFCGAQPSDEPVKDAQAVEQDATAMALAALGEAKNPKDIRKRVLSKHWDQIPEERRREVAAAIKKWLVERNLEKELKGMKDLKGYVD